MANETCRFGELLSRGRLNKDVGRDEVFARFDLCRITPIRVVGVVKADTNIVRRWF